MSATDTQHAAGTKQPTLGAFQAMAEQLVREAELHGVVITIEQRPLKPLAMGHYESVASVRPARGAL